MSKTTPSTMFDPEVVQEMRQQFDAADTDGDGQLDAAEACRLFARACTPDASEEEVKRLADGLRNQLDTDRSGTISFDEYCFRFGRRYQMDAAKRRRGVTPASEGDACAKPRDLKESSATGASKPEEKSSAEQQDAAKIPPADASSEARAAAEELRREREAVQKEREALRREAEELQRERERASTSGTTRNSSSFSGGAYVVLQGLKSAPELNGRLARVLNFDTVTERYVVELEGGGGQKKLKPENLMLSQGSSGPSTEHSRFAWVKPAFHDMTARVKPAFQDMTARVQVWMAGYEWWQLLLGAAVVVLFLATWLQLNSRYPAPKSGAPSPPKAAYREEWATRAEANQHAYREDPSHEDYHDDEDFQRRHGAGGRRMDDHYRHVHPERESRYEHAGGHDNGYSSSYGSGFGEYGQLYTLVVVAGLAYACWKGIIPVHRMSWFELMMLWNFLEPLLFGGRGGGMGRYGGFGRRRRGFF